MRAFLDASEVTVRCQQMRYTPDMNALWSAEIRLASQYATGITEGGTELIITDNAGSTVLFAGPCWYGEDDGDSNNQFSTITGFDHRVKWPYRQVQDADGDYSDPSIFQDWENAVDIMANAITNDIANDGSYGITLGSISASSFPLIGYKPSDWPWSLQTLWEFLANTGTLDVMLIPAVGSSQVALFPGDAGTDLSGSVSFDYNTGSNNCLGAKYTFDMKNTISRIRYFLGPKRPQYRGDIQHFSGDVQIDDPELDIYDPVKQAQIDSQSAAMEAITGRLREIQIYDSNPPLPDGVNPPEQTGENALRDLYYALWQSEMLVRTVPRRLLSVTPMPGIFPAFGLGDLITVNAVIRGTVPSSVQRVYRYTVEMDTEGNEMITDLITSADGM
jgi:hypothetical protein